MIFAIVFGILVDRFDHINAQIDKFVKFDYATSYPNVNPFPPDPNTENYLIDEELTRKCIIQCYTKGLYFDYMKPDKDIYETISSDFNIDFGTNNDPNLLSKKIDEL